MNSLASQQEYYLSNTHHLLNLCNIKVYEFSFLKALLSQNTNKSGYPLDFKS